MLPGKINPSPDGTVPRKPIRAYHPHCWICLGNPNHLRYAFREYRIVSLDNFTILAQRGNLPKGMVIILGLTRQEQVIVDDSNSRVRPGIPLGNFNGAVRRAIIDQYVFPVLIRLLEYALDTFGQKWFRIIERRYYAYERRCVHIFLLHLTSIPNPIYASDGGFRKARCGCRSKETSACNQRPPASHARFVIFVSFVAKVNPE